MMLFITFHPKGFFSKVGLRQTALQMDLQEQRRKDFMHHSIPGKEHDS